MKKLIILYALFSLCFSISCVAGGKKSLRQELNRERKDQDKRWRPCQDFEAENPVGKLCNRRNGKSKVRDFCADKDFNFFRDNAAIMVDEDLL